MIQRKGEVGHKWTVVARFTHRSCCQLSLFLHGALSVHRWNLPGEGETAVRHMKQLIVQVVLRSIWDLGVAKDKNIGRSG